MLYPLVLLAVSTGARRGELLGLRWKAVDLDRRVIRLEQTKNGDRRALPLVGPSLEAMRELARVCGGSTAISSSRAGAAPSPSSYYLFELRGRGWFTGLVQRNLRLASVFHPSYDYLDRHQFQAPGAVKPALRGLVYDLLRTGVPAIFARLCRRHGTEPSDHGTSSYACARYVSPIRRTTLSMCGFDRCA